MKMFEGILARSPEELLDRIWFRVEVVNPFEQFVYALDSFAGVTTAEFSRVVRMFWDAMRREIKNGSIFRGTLAKSPEGLLRKECNE